MARSDRISSRFAAAAGLVSAVALFVGVASVNVPRHQSDAATTAWWQVSSHRTGDIVSTFALLVAGLAFVVFAGYLASRLELSDPEGAAPGLVRNAGVLFAAMLFLAGSMGALSRGPAIDNEPIAGLDLLRYLPQIRYTAVGVFAMPAAAVVMGCASFVILRRGGLPRWLGWLGIAMTVVVIALTAVYFGGLGIPALLLWTIATSVALVRVGAPATKSASSPYVVTAG
jgi:hypothetical protein